MSFSKCQVINGDCVRAGEIVNDTIAHSDPSVANEGQQPCDAWEWSPHYTVWKPCFLGLHLYFLHLTLGLMHSLDWVS